MAKHSFLAYTLNGISNWFVLISSKVPEHEIFKLIQLILTPDNLQQLLISNFKLLPQELFLLGCWLKSEEGIQKHLLGDLDRKVLEIHQKLVQILFAVNGLPNYVKVILVLPFLLKKVSLVNREEVVPGLHQ